MPDRSAGEQMPGEERSKRQARAERILDASLVLLQRWGYRKTTLDDIAKQAGVAKATIYLRWKTRESLFETLLLREWLAMVVDFRQNLASNPAGVILSSLSKYIGFMTVSNPLLIATLLLDGEMLGDLMRSHMGQDIIQVRLELVKTYLGLLREKGMLRTDMSMEMQLKMIVAIYAGFFVVDPFMPPGYHFSPAELGEALAETLHRTLEPEASPAFEVVEDVTRTLLVLIDRLIDFIERKYKETET